MYFFMPLNFSRWLGTGLEVKDDEAIKLIADRKVKNTPITSPLYKPKVILMKIKPIKPETKQAASIKVQQ